MRGKSSLPRGVLFVMTLVFIALVPGLVLADEVRVTGNAIVISGGVKTVTITAGGSATVSYYIQQQPANQDGQQGCNANDGSPATLTFKANGSPISSTGTTVTANPSLLTFTQCGQGNSQSVTFSSSTPGTFVITVQVSDTGSGSYDANPATFTLIVNPPPDSTPPLITPAISGTLGNDSWYVSDVTVTWSVTDPESSVTSTSGCDPTTITADTTGLTLTCTATSAGGTASQAVTIKRDATPPEILCAVPDQSMWYGDNVSVSCSASDSTSGLAGPSTFTLSTSVPVNTETSAATTNSQTVSDYAGNTATAGPFTFKIDRKAPTVSCTVPDQTVWYAADVSVTCTASDGGSGLADATDATFSLTTSVPADTETPSATTSSRTVADMVGNSTTVGPYSFKVDKKGPTVTLSCPTGPILQNTTISATWSATDGGSGVAGATSGNVLLDTTQVGSQTLTLPAGLVVDNAGNPSSSVNCTYQVVYQWSGFFAPVDNPSVWNVVQAGRSVPLKFSLNGYQGMNILLGAPRVQFVTCGAGLTDIITETEASTAGSSGLQYDPTTDQYIYVWKTDKAWAGRCGKVVLLLKDGTTREAWFQFRR